MGKSLYSLILSDEVVKKIDVLAHRNGTNRSNYINQILADHASVTTPEMRINDIFGLINDFFGDGDLVPTYVPNQTTMSLKSCLEYKYRPTMKYEVELYHSNRGGVAGQLDVMFRTTSNELLNKLVDFFNLIISIENKVLGEKHSYDLIDGKFTRSICVDNISHYSSNQLANAISKYVKVFDNCLKAYVGNYKSSEEILKMYYNYAKSAKILI